MGERSCVSRSQCMPDYAAQQPKDFSRLLSEQSQINLLLLKLIQFPLLLLLLLLVHYWSHTMQYFTTLTSTCNKHQHTKFSPSFWYHVLYGEPIMYVMTKKIHSSEITMFSTLTRHKQGRQQIFLFLHETNLHQLTHFTLIRALLAAEDRVHM
jgi:hypothetical protein